MALLFICIMPVITLPELSTSLNEVLVPRGGWLPTYFTLFLVHRNTGCRSSESLNKSLWSVPGDGLVYLSPLKGNSTRSFPVSQIPSSYIDWLLGVNNLYDHMTERRLSYSFEMLYKYPNVMKGNKQSALYLFRYHYVQLAYSLGISVSDITSNMGWSSDTIALGYINAVLEY